ncbi:hypothetical protein [Luteipulveratus flavus]|uniref:AMP-dependent synthetase/ligase domain-containing protein n=1 Tax=Luteipulveratus flavus TaxID=3031728 RepID=A0ABT6C9W7_9MICO|nr:hypothetical protein [Luteipulveratus sp. YIM 133296]MDF8265107.1 hypothetical protein [Luteipulveratus sp. YIM 133296]
MTPYRLGAALSAVLGAPVRIRPDLGQAPVRWTTTVLRDHRVRDAGGVDRLRAMATDLPGVTVDAEDLLTFDVDPAGVEAMLAEPLSDTDVAAAGALARDLRDPSRPWLLTRDGRRSTYDDLAALVGDAAARWASARSAGSARVDVAVDDLASATPQNPSFAVLLAHDRLARGRAPISSGRLVALVGEAPMALADTVRTGRTRPWVRHVEAVATEVLSPRPDPPAATVTWTATRAREAARIVLATGLQTVGVPAPAQI